MSEQHYRVIADRDKGDDPSKANIRVGDRYTLQDTGTDDDPLIRIERLVPTTEEVTVDGNIFPVADLPDILARYMRALDDALHREKQHWIEQHEQPSPHPPTREQIAEVLYETQFRGGYHAELDRLIEDARNHWLSQADAVLALLQKGADQ